MKTIIFTLLLFGFIFAHTNGDPHYPGGFHLYDAWRYLTIVNGYVNVGLVEEYPNHETIITSNGWVYHAALYPSDGGDAYSGPFALWGVLCPAVLREEPTKNSKAIKYLKWGRTVYIKGPNNKVLR